MPSDWPITTTEHGMLVAFGELLQQHRFLDRLRQVPIAQKTGALAPRAKVIEFLAGITLHLSGKQPLCSRVCGCRHDMTPAVGAGVSGIEYPQDLNHGQCPLATDPLVARARGLERFAQYSSVSRSLHACDARSVAAVEDAITTFSRPFIDRAVYDPVRRGLPFIYDFDLTGQSVSATSTTYPEAAFGSLRESDQVRRGYQLAWVCLSPKVRRADLASRVSLFRRHRFGRVPDKVAARC